MLMRDQEIQIRKIQIATMSGSLPRLGAIALLSSTAAMQLLANANEDCHPAFPAQLGGRQDIEPDKVSALFLCCKP